MIHAQFVSVWDGGVEIKTKCVYHPETNNVTDVETSDADGLDILDDEYVLLPDGTEIRDFKLEGEERD